MPRYFDDPIPKSSTPTTEDPVIPPLFLRGRYQHRGGTHLRDYYPTTLTQVILDILHDNEPDPVEVL